MPGAGESSRSTDGAVSVDVAAGSAGAGAGAFCGSEVEMVVIFSVVGGVVAGLRSVAPGGVGEETPGACGQVVSAQAVETVSAAVMNRTTRVWFMGRFYPVVLPEATKTLGQMASGCVG